ncbi:MAG: alanyl-tRNA synthetase [Spirochaetes bacterium DG_61]|nr:MAG: alanyl-tRNA synthetase [Spirochaetes bacterium DG_61]
MKEYADPRMHSAEHILNQTMVRMFNCGRSFSSHIEKKKSKCDYRFNRNLTEEEVVEIERRVNKVIAKDLPIGEDFMRREEAESLFDMDRLPDVADQRIRIVRAGDYDACPCIGDHVESTKEIGMFRITTTSHEDGVLRIRFKLTP